MPQSYINDAGTWKPWTPWGKLSGTWYQCKIGWVNDQGIWKKFYTKIVTATLSSTTNVTISDLSAFSSVWSDPYIIKKVIIPNGVTIGATTSAYAIRPGTQWAGDLIIEVQAGGVIQGIGGSANSGVGGSVIYGNVSSTTGANLIVNNYGTVRAGGGGGGQGGNGGSGVWYSGRTVTEGPLYTGVYATAWKAGWSQGDLWWGGAWIGAFHPGLTSYSSGGWVYYRGAHAGSDENGNYYAVSRQTTVYDVPNYTSGGAGGAGGRGQGHDGSNASGSAGAAGGTNAGQGGTGGTGGGWGATGNTGATGNSGNYSGGTAGSTGGLAGYYKYGYVTFNNYNTALGRAG